MIASLTPFTISDGAPNRLEGMEASQPRLVELTLGADPRDWSAAGFTVSDRECLIGGVRLRFDPSPEPAAGSGVTGWVLSGLPVGADLDGLPTRHDDLPVRLSGPPAAHRNGVNGIDHVVVFSSDLERTRAAFEAAGIRCRRVRDGTAPEGSPIRQAFFRFGAVIVEVVEVPSEHAGPAGSRIWGITFIAADLDQALAELGEGELVGRPRAAIQPGRRIATIRKQAGLGLPVALISSQPRE